MSFCWWNILTPRLPRNDFGLRAWLSLAELFREVENVLGQADDRHPASAAGLLEEVVPASNKILELVLPEEYRVGRFG